ncbi:MAG: hypothetical protein WC796_05420 [Candidatus Pacearchaeota archaeon]|jgi:hypothetical protein
MKLLEKHFIKIVISVIILKVFLLFWTAHPFDFWSFVTTIQHSTLYNWNVFEYWNKGNFLIGVWYSFYSLYLVVLNIFSISPDNLLLLHFFFKLPFLFIDLLSGLLIFWIVKDLTNNVRKAKIAFLFWFLNPIVYYVYGIHGHYELLVPFSILLIIFGLMKDRRWIFTALGFVLLFTTKYFVILFVPFIFFYLLFNHKKKPLFGIIIISAAGIIFSFIHLLIYPDLLSQTISSIIDLTQANSPIFITEIKLSPLNLLSTINYFLKFVPTPISNINNPSLFHLANYGIFLAAVLLILHIIIRFYICLKKKSYIFDSFLKDIFLVTMYFLVLLTNFQAHYLCWLIPLFIIFIFTTEFKPFNYLFITYSVVGFIYLFRGELGVKTFFLDIFSNFNPLSLSSKAISTIYLEGSIIISIILVTALLILVYKQKKEQKNKLEGHTEFYLAAMVIIWILILIPFIQGINQYVNQQSYYTKLAFSRDLLPRGVIFGEYTIGSINNNEIIFSGKERSNHLITEVFSSLNQKDKNNFELYILIKNKDRVNELNKVLSNGKFNGCPISEFRSNIYDYSDQSSYDGFKLNVNCLSKRNVLVTSDNISIGNNDLSIFFLSKEVNYSFMGSKTFLIYFLAILVMIIILLTSYFTYKSLKKINRFND